MRKIFAGGFFLSTRSPSIKANGPSSSRKPLVQSAKTGTPSTFRKCQTSSRSPASSPPRITTRPFQPSLMQCTAGSISILLRASPISPKRTFDLLIAPAPVPSASSLSVSKSSMQRLICHGAKPLQPSKIFSSSCHEKSSHAST